MSGVQLIAELTCHSMYIYLIPFPNSIDNHQYSMLNITEKIGCCLILKQNNFNLKIYLI